jgi:hypothetical protein
MAEPMARNAFMIRSFHEETKLDPLVADAVAPFLADVPWSADEAVSKLGRRGRTRSRTSLASAARSRERWITR